MKYKAKHSTLAKIWGRTGENAVFPVTPSTDSWFGESGVKTGRGIREAALASAWNWSRELFTEQSSVVPFGLFEDVGGAGGQVTGAIAPPPPSQPPPVSTAACKPKTPAYEINNRSGPTPSAFAPVALPPSASVPCTPPSVVPEPDQVVDAELTCVDIFAGAGGLAIGLGEVGFKHLALVEHDARIVATLHRNGYAQAIQAEVADVDYAQWSGATLLSGGPPCQPFSAGGLRQGEADKRNGWEAALQATQRLRPHAVLFENVRGMMSPRFAEYRGAISTRLDALGYHHGWHQLDAALYGVPQHRHRVFLVGFLDAAAWAAFTLPPKAAAPVTVRHALRELGPPNGRNGHVLHGNAREYPGHQASRLDAPSKTIIGGGRGLGGGSGTVQLDSGEVRYYTLREAATLQTFPPAWDFDGTWSRAHVEIGNAVPPLLARALGSAIVMALDAADKVAPPVSAPRQRNVTLPTGPKGAQIEGFGTAAIAVDVQTSCAAPSPPNSPNPTPPWLRPRPSP